MAYVRYSDLPPELQAEARALRPHWSPGEFDRFSFWVTHAGQISRRPGHQQLTDELVAEAQLRRDLSGEGVVSKTATEGWKPGTTFHTSGD